MLDLKSHDLLARETTEERIRAGEGGTRTIHCVAFVSDIDREYSDLAGQGVRFVDPPHLAADGWRTVHFEVPEGNLWELAQGSKR